MNQPKNQNAEVLYELLNNSFIDRRQMMADTGILNLTARIANLRNRFGLNIKCESRQVINKHGRTVTYGRWFIPTLDLPHARKVYEREVNL